jgi:t-SNARE complex subunit (syntaxin)
MCDRKSRRGRDAAVPLIAQDLRKDNNTLSYVCAARGSSIDSYTICLLHCFAVVGFVVNVVVCVRGFRLQV